MKNKLLGIIPARGGSKRIPNKNIRSFCGKPLIQYTIDAAVNSGIFEYIHVSTDSNEIAKIASQAGANIDFMREANLACDHTPLFPVIKWVLEKLELNHSFDHVALLMPTMPLITDTHLKEAYSTFINTDQQAPLLGVVPYSAPIEWAYRMDPKSNQLHPSQPGMFEIRSQDLEQKYHDAGCFVFYKKEYILSKSDNMASDFDFRGYVIPREHAIDINDENDWRLAEILFKGLMIS